MSNDLQSDLTADLLRDLSRPDVLPSAAPTGSVPGPAGAVRGLAGAPGPAGAGPGPSRPRTPAVSVTFTPLQWSRPSVRRAAVGTGVAVLGGPWRVELAV